MCIKIGFSLYEINELFQFMNNSLTYLHRIVAMLLHPGKLASLAFRQNLELNLIAPGDLCEDGNSRIAVRVKEADL